MASALLTNPLGSQLGQNKTEWMKTNVMFMKTEMKSLGKLQASMVI